MDQGVLLTSAGRRVSLLQSFRKALKSAGLDGLVVACDVEPQLAAACAVADKAFRVPRVDDPSYLERLLSLCQQHGIGLVVPTIDTELEVLARGRQLFADNGIQIAVSDLDMVRRCSDKRLFPQLAADLGLETPLEFVGDDIEFPAFIKHRFGSSSIGAKAIRVFEDLAPGQLGNPDWVIQKFVDPKKFDEVTVDLYYDRDSQLKAVVPRLRIETRSGEVSKGKTVRGRLYKRLVRELESIPGARGCITLQVFVSKKSKKVYAIEINPRFGGGFPLSHQAGAEFSLWLVQEYLLDQEVKFFDTWQEDLLMLRYDDAVFVKASGNSNG